MSLLPPSKPKIRFLTTSARLDGTVVGYLAFGHLLLFPKLNHKGILLGIRRPATRGKEWGN